MKSFKELRISDQILKVIEEDGFEEPSEIQEKTIPLVLQGRDVIAGSATGSGKTLVFAAKIIEQSEHGRGIQALILTPTRELAEQVARAIKHFSRYKPLKIVAIYGGLSINSQIQALRSADIVIGTPGRILDHLQRDTLILDSLKILVLDEADRMLDMGFIDDVVKIIKNCPEQRQTLLFSATIYDEVVVIASKYMNNPVEVSAEEYVDPKKLSQVFYDVQDNLKFSLLVHLLKKEKSDLVMVFCNTRRNTGFVVKNLNLNGIEAAAVHGGFSQEKRDKVMQEFHAKRTKVLVCTDVAARGLHIEGISHIYNYEIPKDSKDYIHRIGRTARAGKEGKAISLLSSRDYDNFNKVLENDALNIPKEEVPRIDRVFIKSFNREQIQKNQNRFGRSDQRPFHGRNKVYSKYNRGHQDEKRQEQGSRYYRKNSNQRSRYNRGERDSHRYSKRRY
jgi:ATP-dependent RNA helicase DeaD